ncbi:MAG: transcription-repair coupling factor [Bacteroidales bacterium]|nr:transcription-repair coupling factor [Bacteroidales bacterium]
MLHFDVKEILSFISKPPADRSPALLPLKGLAGSSVYFPLLSLGKQSPPKIHVVIKENSTEATYAAADLSVLLGDNQVFLFPASYRGTGKTARPDASFHVQRTIALRAVASHGAKKENLVLVTYPKALNEGIPAGKLINKESLTIYKGLTLTHEAIKEYLFSEGFEKKDFVSEPGHFAIRGSILDVFSYSENRPYRIGFFGDQVESLRVFDQNTQLSIEERHEICVVPQLKGENPLLDEIAEDTVVWSFSADFQEIPGDIPVMALYPVLQDMPHVLYNTSPQPVFNKNFQLLVNDINKRKEMGYRVFVLCKNDTQIRRLEDIFLSLGCTLPFVEYKKISLHEGFTDHNSKQCFYTDHQIFQRIHRVYLKRAVEKSEQITINDLFGFTPGDYVVHIDHGVGIFSGLVKTTTGDKVREAIKILYRDNDVLYVSIHGLHRIARYKSKDSEPPRINKLGTGAWNRIKQKTKEKVKDIAKDLIQLYSERTKAKGFAFSPDTYLQHQLEASFIYEDTPDQLLATQQVKSDMEQSYPMDRLICGDVGFGKTEIAIRAAFKAVTDGKQVAVLVPTTILALQHFHTVSERLADFPVTTEFLSRLKTPAQTRAILQQVQEGKVDILIGTHRLLNKDVIFKDLGLLVVDEEQKFGVSAKERLKLIKTHVDTLTLTATPIPRTLQFSLMGARDMSIIQTPPANRLPIHTELQFFDEEIIRKAIDREMDRGGQMFFVHNRIRDIEQMAEKLQEIHPGIRIAIGHGQLPPRTMEKVLLDFINGHYDLLLSTSIIENGIDIPNANTIIINRAHHFGLSDLHQMRGRVGRSNRKAYCYLLVPEHVPLTEDAKRRLQAMESFTELGSGFNIAMQDLDIRGAGNLLGSEQSGFIAQMGFETYHRILEEAMAELRLESRETVTPSKEVLALDCTIETDLEVMIPDDYISNVSEKIRLYRELDAMKDEQQLQKFFAALEDRFGPLPEPLKQLGYVVRVRRLAITLGFERIVLKNGIMLAYFISNPESTYFQSEYFTNILQYITAHPKNFQVKERKNKLFIKILGVKSIEAAYNFLKIFAKP